jgi:hypothetical protein
MMETPASRKYKQKKHRNTSYAQQMSSYHGVRFQEELQQGDSEAT